jgi:hypothetical protein
MNRRLILIAAGALLLLLLVAAGAVGYLLNRPFPGEGGGQTRNSPDGRWVALATTRHEYSVMGGSRTYSELKIETPAPAPRIVRKMIIQDTAEPTIDWRQEGEIFWTRNSASVTFKCVTGKANLEIVLTP